jgi:SpoVK/Ycf46/Vps4 family AAA+-type ATPase
MHDATNKILQSIDEINLKVNRNSKFTEELVKSLSRQIKIVGNYLGLDDEELIIWWSMFVNLTVMHTSVSFDDIASFLHLNTVKVMSFAPTFDKLIGLKILRRERSDGRRRRRPDRLTTFNYFVPSNIINSLTRNEATLPTVTKGNLTKYQILDIVYNLVVNDMSNELLTYDGLVEEIEQLFADNPDNKFLNLVSSYHLPIEDQIVLFISCCEMTDNSSVDLTKLFRILYSDVETQMMARKKFLRSETKLQQLELVDLKTDTFKSDREVELTEKGRNVFFSEDLEFFMKNEVVNQKDLILHESIQEKPLFYNEEDKKNLDFLTQLLLPENRILEKMQKMQTRPQVMILLSGMPGIGKSEFVLQLARRTKRDVKRVDLSEVKSHFYSDSEKLTAKIFRDYASLYKVKEIKPIMYIDEIDGWLGQRSIGGSSAVDSTEHAIQSILLMLLSEFEGILVGCTNIHKRLDPSYMRRFGFKYEIHLPNEDTRVNLWKDRLPNLTDEQVLYLAHRHNLAGGSIDNVCRKIVLTQLVYETSPDLQQIDQFCFEEFLDRPNEKRKIGYLG